MIKTISNEAQAVISAYTNISIGNISIPCLYYNNKRQGVRAGLRVSIGKGSPKDIEDEIAILAQKDKVYLATMDEDMARMFLQKHNIGVDCSALAYYVLDAEVRARANTSLKSMLKYPFVTNPIRKLLIKLRPVENTNVKTLAHDCNSTEIAVGEVQPGDIITILEGGRDHTWYHVMVIHEVSYTNDGTPQTIHYTHSYQWPSDGQYGHGVRTGCIDIVDTALPLLQQSWREQGKQGDANETWLRASQANKVQLRRLNILN